MVNRYITLERNKGRDIEVESCIFRDEGPRPRQKRPYHKRPGNKDYASAQSRQEMTWLLRDFAGVE